jgi:hypothetical protein
MSKHQLALPIGSARIVRVIAANSGHCDHALLSLYGARYDDEIVRQAGEKKLFMPVLSRKLTGRAAFTTGFSAGLPNSVMRS